jgi:hypothetical protein
MNKDNFETHEPVSGFVQSELDKEMEADWLRQQQAIDEAMKEHLMNNKNRK